MRFEEEPEAGNLQNSKDGFCTNPTKALNGYKGVGLTCSQCCKKPGRLACGECESRFQCEQGEKMSDGKAGALTPDKISNSTPENAIPGYISIGGKK